MHVARDSFLPKLKAEVLAIVGRKLAEELFAFDRVLARQQAEPRFFFLVQGIEQQFAQVGEGAYQLGLVVRERIVEHPHPGFVAMRQAQVFHGVHHSGLAILELMKMFVH